MSALIAGKICEKAHRGYSHNLEGDVVLREVLGGGYRASLCHPKNGVVLGVFWCFLVFFGEVR